jgi:uncharacterized membrane protein YqaE (UPF0057 family)
MRRKLFVVGIPAMMLLFSDASFASFGKKDSTARMDTTVNKNIVDERVQKSMEDFKSLSKREKRSRLKEMKKAIKEFRAKRKAGDDVSTNTLLLVIIAILIPPLAVYIHEGDINNKFWISVLLTILGYVIFGFAGILFLGSLPGILYALYVILAGG